MPVRTLLSSEQRTRLFSIPTDTAEMVRHYTLGADDVALIRTKRRPINRPRICYPTVPSAVSGPGMGPVEHRRRP